MKILHVNKFFDLHGGAEGYMHRLMEKQAAAGHEVHAFSTRAPHNLPSDDADYFVERFDYKHHEGLWKDARKGISFIWNAQAEAGMRRAIVDTQPDVIHLHNIYHHLSTSILAPIRHAKIPCVQTLHDYKLACPNYKMFTEGAPCERCKGGHYLEAVKHHCLSAGSAENILAAVEMGMTKLVQSYERTIKTFICPSRFMADKMAAWGEPPSKLRVVTNPCEMSEASALLDGNYIFIGGRLSPEKGIETVVRAIANVPGLELRLAGTGPEEAKLRTIIASQKITNVTFLGFLRKNEMEEQRRHALAVVMPSIWYENASLAVLEAMSEGLPVIASRIGGLPEQVEHKVNGILVDPGNVGAWTDALKEFVALPSEARKKMGQTGRKMAAERYNWTDHLASIEDVYRKARA